MQPGRNWNEYSGMAKGSPYPPLDSLSVTEELEPRQDFIYERGGVNYKPLVALNIDIGEDVPVKIYVYDFTDPWKRAYEFLKAYDLPEEMHEDIALLIGNAKEAKEKELRLQRLAQEKKVAMQGSRKQQLEGRSNSDKRRTSCDVKFSNGSSRNCQNEFSKQRGQLIFGDQKDTRTLSKNSSLSRNKSIEHKFSPKQVTSASKLPFTCTSEFDGKNEVPEKSNFLDSTTLMSSISDKNKTMAQASPFESNFGDTTDLEYSALRTTNSHDKRHTIESLTSPRLTQDIPKLEGIGYLDKAANSKQSSELSKQDEIIKNIFDRLDYEGGGVVRSYDVYLSDLPSDTKNVLQVILSDQDDRESFKSFDLEDFRKALLASHDFLSLRIHN